MENEIDIYLYQDYRKFLLDWYENKKSQNKNYTYRFIAQRVQLDSGYLSKVFHGKKHISTSSISTFSKLLKLDEKQIEFFELLVLFGKEKKEENVKKYFETMIGFVIPEQTQVKADQYEFYQKWYYTAIRELINVVDYSDDINVISDSLCPKVPKNEVKKAIKLLQRLKFISKDENGIYRQTSRYITVGEKWGSIAIRQYHRNLIKLAGQSIDRFEPQERDLSNMTLSLSQEGYKQLIDKAKQFRQEVFALCRQDQQSAEQVFEMNMQIFPVSKKL